MGGQGDLYRLMMTRHRLLKSAALVLLGAFSLWGGSAQAASPDRQTPSGMPVPRYVSLKFEKVNARAGPGDDHKLLFVYRVRGLPLLEGGAENVAERRARVPALRDVLGAHADADARARSGSSVSVAANRASGERPLREAGGRT